MNICATAWQDQVVPVTWVLATSAPKRTWFMPPVWYMMGEMEAMLSTS